MLVPARRVHSASARQVPDSWSEFEQAVFWYLTIYVSPMTEGGLYWATDVVTAVANRTINILKWEFIVR